MSQSIRTTIRFGIATNATAELAGRALSVLAGILLAKAYPPGVLGTFFGDQAMVLMGAGVYNLGIVQGYRQLAARNPGLRARLLVAATLARLGALILYGALIGLVALRHREVSTSTILIVVGTLALSFTELVQTDLIVRREFRFAAWIGLSKGLVLVVPAGIVFGLDLAYDKFVVAYLACILLVAVPGLGSVLRSARWPRRCDWSPLMIASGPFVFSIAAFAFTNSFGLHQLRSVQGSEAAGIFGVAWKVYQVSLVLGMATSAVILPVFHRVAQDGQLDSLDALRDRVLVTLLALMGLGVPVLVHSPEFVLRVVATGEYASAAELFLPLSAALVFRTLSIPFENQLEALGRQRVRVGILLAGAGITGVGCVVLVSRVGAMGVAITMVAVDAMLLLFLAIAAGQATRVSSLAFAKLRHVIFLLGLTVVVHVTVPTEGVRVIVQVVIWAIFSWTRLGLRDEVRRLRQIYGQ